MEPVLGVSFHFYKQGAPLELSIVISIWLLFRRNTLFIEKPQSILWAP